MRVVPLSKLMTQLIAFWLCLSAHVVLASSEVFYSLPSQSQGKVFAAKQLFLAEGGGLWLQDVRAQILFFDGQNVAPNVGSALTHDVDKVAYADHAFWSFFRNEIYRTLPNQERELVLSLTPGTDIHSIGASGDYIWLADERYFYTYHIPSGELDTLSLMELYQFTQSSTIIINDAQFVVSKWVLATNAGAYVSDRRHFEHVPLSQQHYIEKLHYSAKRGEIVVGTLSGALVFNIHRPTQMVADIPGSHVLSLAETDDAYWIGTEHGLIIYSHNDGAERRLGSQRLAGHPLYGERIYSIVNDEAGGIWLATDKGVRYYSLFSPNFQRFDPQLLSEGTEREQPLMLEPMAQRQGYWLLTTLGLYQLDLTDRGQRTLVYQGAVSDVMEHQETLWLATPNGVITLPLSRLAEPQLVSNAPVAKYLEVDSQGHIWGASDQQLWRYDPERAVFRDFVSDWMLTQYLPAQLTYLKSAGERLLIGTDHGLYFLERGVIKFVDDSSQYGGVSHIIEVADDELWVAGQYGLYRVDTATGITESLALIDGHISPKCLMSNEQGIWLTTSAGLSQYTLAGELKEHYGEPLGLRNNEFVTGLCGAKSGREHTLLMGSSHHLMAVDTERLAYQALPSGRVVVSQVNVGQERVALGHSPDRRLTTEFGESLSFQFGVMPQLSGAQIEYRLDNEPEWQVLEGVTLTIEHVLPGLHQLSVRVTHNGRRTGQEDRFEFLVNKPWYLEHSSLGAAVVLLCVCVVGIVYWRSRLMAKANRALKAQVELKTHQLEHQSRVLLANNVQLRKQLHIRRLIYAQSVASLQSKLTMPPYNSAEFKPVVDRLSQELALSIFAREANKEADPVYHFNLIFHAAIDGWQEEIRKSGQSLDIEWPQDQAVYLSLNAFNLDEILNVLIDNVIKRGYRNQTVMMRIDHNVERLALTVLDQGESIDHADLGQDYLMKMSQLVEASGGSVTIHCSKERNMQEFTWPVSDHFTERSAVKQLPHSVQEESDPWFAKLKAIVEAHYAEADFGLSRAAQLLYVSERSLQRRLKSHQHTTFTEYLNEVRLDHACRRLLAGEKVSDVAFECGFNDPSYFSQRFKYRFGMSPTQFVEGQGEE